MATRDIRLLILSSTIARGGADKQIVGVSRYLKEKGYSIKIISLSPLGIMGFRGIEDGLDIVPIDLKNKKRLIQRICKLIYVIVSWRPDVLATFMFHATIIGRLLKMLFLVPIHVSSVRNENIGGRRREQVFRHLDRFDDAITVNSENAGRILLQKRVLSRDKMVVIPNGIDVLQFWTSGRCVSKDVFVWIIVARITVNKGYDNLLEAVDLLVKEGKEFVLKIVGEGKLSEQIKGKARDLRLSSHVEFLGARSDIPELLSTADAFVLSSAWEGMPNVVMEALAASLPVVATEVGGVSELVVQNKSGYLVDAGDPWQLSRAMRRMMELPKETREQMAEFGRSDW